MISLFFCYRRHRSPSVSIGQSPGSLRLGVFFLSIRQTLAKEDSINNTDTMHVNNANVNNRILASNLCIKTSHTVLVCIYSECTVAHIYL